MTNLPLDACDPIIAGRGVGRVVGGGGGWWWVLIFTNISGYYLLHGDIACVVNDLRFQARQLHPHLKEADMTLGIRFYHFFRNQWSSGWRWVWGVEVGVILVATRLVGNVELLRCTFPRPVAFGVSGSRSPSPSRAPPAPTPTFLLS